MEDGHWVVVGNMRAWVSSMHLVHEKEAQLRRMQAHLAEHRLSQLSKAREDAQNPICDT